MIFNEKQISEICTKTILNKNYSIWQLNILKILKLKPNLWKIENNRKSKSPLVDFFYCNNTFGDLGQICIPQILISWNLSKVRNPLYVIALQTSKSVLFSSLGIKKWIYRVERRRPMTSYTCSMGFKLGKLVGQPIRLKYSAGKFYTLDMLYVAEYYRLFEKKKWVNSNP